MSETSLDVPLIAAIVMVTFFVLYFVWGVGFGSTNSQTQKAAALPEQGRFALNSQTQNTAALPKQEMVD